MPDIFPFWVVAIIIAVVLGVLWGIASGLLAFGGVLLAASFQKDVQHPSLLQAISGFVLAVAIYLCVEALRLGYWRLHYYNPSDDTATKPPPNLLIMELFRWLKGSHST